MTALTQVECVSNQTLILDRSRRGSEWLALDHGRWAGTLSAGAEPSDERPQL